MVKDIIGRVRDKTKTLMLGTCFLVSKKYAFTARHVLENKATKVVLKEVHCNFEYKNQSTLAKLIYEDVKNDFVVLELEKNIESDFYRISKYVIEEKDQWKSSGYTTSGLNNVNFSGYVTEKRDNNRYEVYIHNQEDSGEWSGSSGAPVIIEKEIAGIVVEEESGGNIKTRLEIVSMESITDKLQMNNPEVLEFIEKGYHPLLQDRLNSLSCACKEIFHIYTDVKDKNIFKYHVFIEDDISVINLAKILKYSIHDYGVDLLLEEQYGRAIRMNKREIEDKIDNKKQHIMNLIRNGSQLIHILLWILIEGELGYPRIGSYIVDEMNNIPRDIYINNDSENTSIIIGNGYLDKSIIDLFENCVNEIDYHLEKNSSKKNIIIKDKLVIESLNYSIQDKIKMNIFSNIEQSGIRLSVAILIGFSNEQTSRTELNKDEKIEYLKNCVEGYEEQFRRVIKKSILINNIDINWFFIPFKDASKFNYEFKNKYL